MEEFEQLCLWKEYEPEVDDYVRWDKPTSMNVDEGWVYFKCNQYITIELQSDLDHHVIVLMERKGCITIFTLYCYVIMNSGDS